MMRSVWYVYIFVSFAFLPWCSAIGKKAQWMGEVQFMTQLTGLPAAKAQEQVSWDEVSIKNGRSYFVVFNRQHCGNRQCDYHLVEKRIKNKKSYYKTHLRFVGVFNVSDKKKNGYKIISVEASPPEYNEAREIIRTKSGFQIRPVKKRRKK